MAAQKASFNFHHLTTANGLCDPVVRSIVQDKYGYIWLGTINGLNRFNGYDVKIFQHRDKDNFSLAENDILSLLCDTKGNLWISLSNGIYKYEYASNHFILQPGSEGISSRKMMEDHNGGIFMATSKGLILFNTKTGRFGLPDNKEENKTLLSKPVNDFCFTGDSIINIATATGLIVYNTADLQIRNIDLKPINNKNIAKLATDHHRNLWVSYDEEGPMLLKVDASYNKYEAYPQFKGFYDDYSDNKISSVFSDNRGRIWIGTIRKGIFLYNEPTNDFAQFEHDPLQSMSLSNNFIPFFYQDRNGFIWMGSEGYGAEYFHPDNNLFHTIQPSYNQNPTLPDYWCRAAGEDKNGNLWLGTSGGVAQLNILTNQYSVLQNKTAKPSVLYANSIRSIFCNDDDVWIGSSNGLNRYNIATGKMDFFGSKDSIPTSFFRGILRDHEGNMWFASRNGLYRYNSKSKKMEGFDKDALLAPYSKKNILSLYEDRHNQLWIGFFLGGLLRYDLNRKEIEYYREGEANLNTGGITSIVEDRSGIIWLGTLTGLTSFDHSTNSFRHYQTNYANISEIISCLLCDDKDRLWMASSTGLSVLDSARAHFKTFGISDGLPTVDFNNQSAFRLRNGDFIYPTLKGFVQFNPGGYRNDNPVYSAYISSLKIFGKELNTPVNIEELKSISLTSRENFFSIEMTGLNYENQDEIWYAHKLEPFDRDWVYSKERIVSYTNVPGGKYIFRFKASAGFDNQDAKEKSINIFVATVFYKTWWFLLLTFIVVLGSVYALYKFRIRQKEKLMILQGKAHSLEREKVQAMYETLKQQLNPHFLFNSLTSLSSLISSNPANAKQFLDRMSKIYRYILKSSDNETVPLTDEIKLAEIYTQLQQTRFKQGLQLIIDIPEDYLYRKIAPVTLQNLIENAIKHNVIDIATPLVIKIFIQDEWVVVQNNLQKKSFVESSNQQGLSSMQSLYKYLSGKQMGITEDKNYFTVKIPLL